MTRAAGLSVQVSRPGPARRGCSTRCVAREMGCASECARQAEVWWLAGVLWRPRSEPSTVVLRAVSRAILRCSGRKTCRGDGQTPKRCGEGLAEPRWVADCCAVAVLLMGSHRSSAKSSGTDTPHPPPKSASRTPPTHTHRHTTAPQRAAALWWPLTRRCRRRKHRATHCPCTKSSCSSASDCTVSRPPRNPKSAIVSGGQTM